MSVDEILKKAIRSSSEWRHRDSLEHWQSLRSSGEFAIVPDLHLFGLAVHIGRLDIAAPIIDAYRLDNGWDIHTASILKSYNELAQRQARYFDVPKRDHENESALRIDGRALLEARLLDQAKDIWLILRRSNAADFEATKRLMTIANWEGDWEGVVDYGQAALAIKSDDDEIREVIGSAEKVMQRKHDRFSTHVKRFYASKTQSLVETLCSRDAGAVATVRAELNAIAGYLASEPEPEPDPERAVQPTPKAPEADIPDQMLPTKIAALFYQPADAEDGPPATLDGENFHFSTGKPSSVSRLLIELPAGNRFPDRLEVKLPLADEIRFSGMMKIYSGRRRNGLLNTKRLGGLESGDVNRRGAISAIISAGDINFGDLAGDELRFAIFSFEGPASVAVQAPAFTHIDFRTTPGVFNYSHHPAHRALAAHNERLSVAERDGLLDWLIEEARLALALDCIETADGIVSLILSSFYRAAQRDPKFLSIFADRAFATGQIETVREMFIANADVALSKKSLARVFRSVVLGHASASSSAPPRAAVEVDSLRAAVRAFRRVLVGQASASSPEPPPAVVATDGRATGNLSDMTAQAIFANPEHHGDKLLLANAVLELSRPAHANLFNAHLASRGVEEMQFEPVSENFLACLAPQPKKAMDSDDLPPVTLIVAAFECEDTIEYALRSLLDQNYPNIEILVCDDCSPDQTWDRLKALEGDPRLSLFQSNANQGPYNIRNALIERAKGDYIGFHDADDLSHPDRVGEQLDLIRSTSAQAAITNGLRVRPNGQFVYFRDNLCERQSTISMIARADCFRELGDYWPTICGADSDYMERIRLWRGSASIVHVNKPLVYSLWAPGSLTMQSKFRASEDGFKSAERRAFAEISARRRLLGPALVSEEDVMDVLVETGLYRSPAGVTEYRN